MRRCQRRRSWIVVVKEKRGKLVRRQGKTTALLESSEVSGSASQAKNCGVLTRYSYISNHYMSISIDLLPCKVTFAVVHENVPLHVLAPLLITFTAYSPRFLRPHLFPIYPVIPSTPMHHRTTATSVMKPFTLVSNPGRRSLNFDTISLLLTVINFVWFQYIRISFVPFFWHSYCSTPECAVLEMHDLTAAQHARHHRAASV